MGQPTTNSSAEFSSSIAREERHSELAAETSSHRGMIPEPMTVERHNEDLPKSKKPRAFNLAFVGLGVAVFVFQLDATALGVALPVSPFPCFDKIVPNYKAGIAD